MVASAFLPVTIYKDKLLFLFGKEAHDRSAPGFSDFGGGVKEGENIFYAGLREFAEETTGFFGDEPELIKMIKKNGGIYSLIVDNYHIHIFRIDYDPKLIEYFNNSHKFVEKHIRKDILKKSMIFEKNEIKWMTTTEMKKRKREFRHFYQKILDHILLETNEIKQFILSTY